MINAVPCTPHPSCTVNGEYILESAAYVCKGSNLPAAAPAAVVLLQSSNLEGRVDGSRLALWGVSYSGGHALVTAAKLGRNVSVVIANVSMARTAKYNSIRSNDNIDRLTT